MVNSGAQETFLKQINIKIFKNRTNETDAPNITNKKNKCTPDFLSECRTYILIKVNF